MTSASRRATFSINASSLSPSSPASRPPAMSPWWEFSNVSNELLLERGIKYDHSLIARDHQPCYVRVGDSWTKIDYSKHPLHLDDAAQARSRDGSDRDSGELVSRRPAADDVHGKADDGHELVDPRPTSSRCRRTS